MKNVSVKFCFATARISVVIFKILPTVGIVRRNPKILSEIQIKLQSIKGQIINHKIKLTHCRYQSQPMHEHSHTRAHTRFDIFCYLSK